MLWLSRRRPSKGLAEGLTPEEYGQGRSAKSSFLRPPRFSFLYYRQNYKRIVFTKKKIAKKRHPKTVKQHARTGAALLNYSGLGRTVAISDQLPKYSKRYHTRTGPPGQTDRCVCVFGTWYLGL